jgi:hypothetical protein
MATLTLTIKGGPGTTVSLDVFFLHEGETYEATTLINDGVEVNEAQQSAATDGHGHRVLGVQESAWRKGRISADDCAKVGDSMSSFVLTIKGFTTAVG